MAGAAIIGTGFVGRGWAMHERRAAREIGN